MHRHSEQDIPAGYVPMIARYDPEDETFSATVCLEGLHVAVEIPIDSPQLLANLVRVSPLLTHMFVTALTDGMDHSSEMKEKFIEAVTKLDQMEQFLNQLRETPLDQVVQWVQGE